MKSVLERAIKPIFPRLIRTGSEADISPECQAALLKMILGIRSMKTWALHSKWSCGKIKYESKLFFTKRKKSGALVPHLQNRLETTRIWIDSLAEKNIT